MEIISDWGVGKTHFCSCIPNSAMIDLTPIFEGDVIFIKNRTEQEFDELYTHVSSFDEIRRVIRNLPESVKTLSFDGSAYLIGMVEAHWCKEQTKKREAALQREYGELYSMVRDDILLPLIKRPCNIVFTSYLKDEYIDEQKTGRRIRRGYTPFDTIRDIGLLLYKEEEKRRNKIVKNRFLSETIVVDGEQIANPSYIIEMKPEATWQKLLDVICVEGSAYRKEWLL